MRRQREDDDWQPDMPPVEMGRYLIGYLFEVGPTMHGPAVLSHQEISAWQALSGIRLQPWEARFLRRLSAEYLRESLEAENPDRPAPWKRDEVSLDDMNAVADAMRKSMRRLAAL